MDITILNNEKQIKSLTTAIFWVRFLHGIVSMAWVTTASYVISHYSGASNINYYSAIGAVLVLIMLLFFINKEKKQKVLLTLMTIYSFTLFNIGISPSTATFIIFSSIAICETGLSGISLSLICELNKDKILKYICYQSLVYGLGAGVGSVIFYNIINNASWNMVYVASAVIMIISLIIFALAISKNKIQLEEEKNSDDPASAQIKQLLSDRSVVITLAALFLITCSYYFTYSVFYSAGSNTIALLSIASLVSLIFTPIYFKNRDLLKSYFWFIMSAGALILCANALYNTVTLALAAVAFGLMYGAAFPVLVSRICESNENKIARIIVLAFFATEISYVFNLFKQNVVSSDLRLYLLISSILLLFAAAALYTISKPKELKRQ